MAYKLIKKLDSGVRIGELMTPHGKIETPFFMPVGTVGSVKAVSPKDLDGIGAQIILSNTYHLYLRPGEQLIKKLGGLHQFMRWDKPILTDSGGYQVFSLAKGNNHNKDCHPELTCHPELVSGSVLVSGSLDSGSPTPSNFPHLYPTLPPLAKGRGCSGRGRTAQAAVRNDSAGGSLVKITEEGIEFRSHLDGSKHLFTPEKVIQIQLDLGVDILMPLDVCPSGKADRAEVERAVEITIAWAKRAKEYFVKSLESRVESTNSKRYTLHTKPMLHGIVQGGLYEDLRRHCADELIKLDFDGYSVGGLAVDLETRDMWKIVKLMGEILPEDKPRYLMGVGTPDDIIKATRLGMDMFDCVLPTRLARHGSAYVRDNGALAGASTRHFELKNLLNAQYREDGGVLDENCGCEACQEGKGFGKAYISHLVRSNEILGIRLLTLHNLWQYLNLMRELRSEN